MNIFELAAKITLDTSDFEKGTDGAREKAQSFGDTLKSGLGTLATVGAAAIGTATTALVAFGGSAVDTGMQFDSAMSQVAATLGLTTSDIENNLNGAGDTFDALRQKALEMGSSTNFTAQQASEGLNILAMSGYDAEQSMSMIEDVLHLAAAGSMDMAEAAGYVSGAMKGFNDSTKDSGYYADLMAKGATLANTSVSQLGEAMSSGAAGAAAYGQTADSMTVSLLRLAEQGEVGSAAGTALAAAMKNLFTPTDQAAKALDELGVSAYDSSGSARDFNAVVNDLSAALSGMSAEEANAYKQTIFGIQGLDAFNKMTVTGIDKQNEWAAALAMASDGTGEASKQYDTMTDNLQGDIDLWNSALDGFKIAISDKLMPTIREFVEFGGDSVSRITEAFQSGGLSGAMDALGAALSEGLSMIVELLPEAVSAGGQLLGALAQGIIDNLPILLDSAVQIVTNLLEGLAENADGVVDGALNLVEMLGQGIIDAAPALLTAAAEAVTAFAEAIIDTAPDLLESGLELVEQVADGVIDALPELIAGAGKLVETLSGYIVDNAPGLLSSGFALITNVVQGIINNLPAIGQAAVQTVDRLLTFVVENASTMWRSGNELLLNIVHGIIDNLPQLVASAVQIVANLAATIGEHLPEILETGITMLGELIAGLIAAIPDLVAAIPQIIMSIVTTFGSHDWGSIGTNIISGIATGIRNGVSTIINAAREAASSALNAAKSFLGIASPSKRFRDEVGKMITLGISGGMVAPDVLNTLKEAAGTVTQYVANMFGVDLGGEDNDAIKAVESWAKAWEEGLNETVQNIEHTIFLMTKNGKSSKDIIKAYKQIQDELHAQAEQARAMGMDENDQYLQGLQKQWWDYEDEIEKVQQAAYQNIVSVVKQFATEYEKAINEVTRKQDSLASKLASFGDLYSYIDEDRGILNLEDLEAQADAILQLGDNLQALRARGLDEGLLSEIAQMDHKTAWNLSSKLLESTDKAFNAYNEGYKRKIDAAARVAQEFYAKDLQSLEMDYLSKVPDLLIGLADDMELSGGKWADAITEGFAGKSGAMVESMKATLDGVYSQVDAYLELKNTSFAESALGAASAATVNAVSSQSGSSTPISITIEQSIDGDKFASATYDSRTRVDSSKGVASGGVTARLLY